MAGPDDLLRYPLPAGWSEEPALRINVAPAASATGLSDGPAPPAPIDPNVPPSPRMSPLTALDPAMWPAAPSATDPAAMRLPGSGARQGAGDQFTTIPVDHDPFEQTLKPPLSGQVMVPVDYDPFNPFDVAALRTRASVLGNKQATADDRSQILNRLFDVNFGRNGTERFQWFPERWARAAIGEFGRAAQGQFPDTVYVPEGGSVSDEDLARRYADMNAGAESATNFAMIGGPLNMVMKGARPGGATLGSAMGTGAGKPRLRVAAREPDGTVHVGDAGETHADIVSRNEGWFKKYGDRNIDDMMGWVGPDGKFMDRGEAYDWYRANVDAKSKLPNGDMGLGLLTDDIPDAVYGGKGGAVLGTAGAEDGKGRVSAGPVVPAPPFYSAVEKAVEDATLKQAGPEQWLGTLKNAKGVKGEELSWLGLEDWLRERGASKPGQNSPPAAITKQEVLDFIRQNKVELKEVRKFDPESDAYHEAIMERIHTDADSILEDWKANSHALARGVGIKVRPAMDLNGGWEVAVKTDRGESVINRNPTKDGAQAFAEDFKQGFPEQDWTGLYDIAMEAAHNTGVRDSEFVARHDSDARKLPGGENYREILLTLPSKADFKVQRNANGDWDIMTGGRRGGTVAGRLTEQQALEEARANYRSDGDFRVSGHWLEPNVLAWSRVDDRAIPRPHTAEETAVIEKRAEAQRKLDELKPKTDAAAIELQELSARLENARVKRIREDMDAGRITMLAARKALEEYVEKPELKPLQDKLAALRKQEDDIRASMPPEPKPAQTRSLFIEEIQSDWHQQGREKGYKGSDTQIAKELMDAYSAWQQKNGLPDQSPVRLQNHINDFRGTKTEDELKQISRELLAWQEAFEARNPEVFDLTLKADESRMARTRATENAWRDAARPIMQAKADRTGRPGSIEDSLPTSQSSLADLYDSGVIDTEETILINSKANATIASDETYLAAHRKAEDDQRALELAQRKNRSGVPDAPLKKGWHEMVLKRMIREAAEKGYDSISWTTGAQQNKRWRLSNFVDALIYDPLHNRLMGYGKGRRGQDGGRPDFSEVVPPDKLPEYIGKEAAEKLLAQPRETMGGQPDAARGFHRLETNNLEVGGQGMRGFYDKMLVDAANKLAKPFGGKVTSGRIKTGDADGLGGDFTIERSPRGMWEVWHGQEDAGVLRAFSTKVEAEKWVREQQAKGEGETVHVLDITPTMRDSAIGKGFPLFMGGVPVVRVDHDPFAEDERKRGQ